MPSPLYQFSMILAPVYFCNSFAKELRHFLWKGGKSNSKHFHLVNWNIVGAPKNHGGLGIRDPTIMNKVLGAKILWRLITGRKELWKYVLNKKYFPGPRMRCLDNLTPPHLTLKFGTSSKPHFLSFPRAFLGPLVMVSI
jgi:hypothetical protein